MAQETQNPDKEKIMRMFDEGMDALSEALHGVDEPTAKTRPAIGGWSVLECVEHLTLTELGLLSRLREAQPCNESHEDRAREAKFQDLALNRLRRIEAPEPVIPQNQTQTLAQAVDDFQAARRETLQFVQDFSGNLHWSLALHPLITRPVNCYEMLLLMALHPRRHALQIAQVREIIAGQTQSS